MARDTDQPSITQRYAQTQAHGPHPDVGADTAQMLARMSLEDRARYAEPTADTTPLAAAGLSTPEAMHAQNFNTMPGAPVKYAAPNPMDEHLAAKQEIRDAIGQIPQTQNAVMRTDPITDLEVEAYRRKVDQVELSKFEDYVTAKYDMDRPGEFSWLMKIYPEYVYRRLEQQHTDFNFAVHNNLIEQYGVQTFDDLYFKYQIDQGYIDGPHLTRTNYIDDKYVPGLLSVFAFRDMYQKKQKEGTFLPGARNRLAGSRKPGNPAQWQLKNRPLSQGRDEIAASISSKSKAVCLSKNNMFSSIAP